jgi:hypothetical protein
MVRPSKQIILCLFLEFLAYILRLAFELSFYHFLVFVSELFIISINLA